MAFYNQIDSEDLENLPIRMKPNTEGGADFFAKAADGNWARYMTINPAGGHVEHSIHTSLPQGTALEIEDGYVLFHKT